MSHARRLMVVPDHRGSFYWALSLCSLPPKPPPVPSLVERAKHSLGAAAPTTGIRGFRAIPAATRRLRPDLHQLTAQTLNRRRAFRWIGAGGPGSNQHSLAGGGF